ncbi:helix-turn-helix domain-containing protein [Streptomyces sp. NPDC002076]
MRLVAELRILKDRTPVTLAELATATAISKSSWERYLNGKQFPPLHAVRALCRATGEDEARLDQQWEAADAAWGRRGHGSADRHLQPSANPVEASVARFPRQLLLAASGLIDRRPRIAAAAVFLLCAMMLVPAAVIHASSTSSPAPATHPPVCRLGTCEGRNPRTTACEDPMTLAKHTAADGTRLEIRASPTCRAGWIRAWPTHPGFRIEITGPQAHTQSVVSTGRPVDQQLITTTMIAAPRPSSLRACYYPANNSPGRECFE